MSSLNDRILAQGETLFLQDAEAHSAFLVKEGLLEISTLRDGVRTVVAHVGPGELIGEMAIVDGSRRSATVTAATPATLFEFTRDQFERRLGSTDPIVRMVLAVVLRRIRGMLGAETRVAETAEEREQLETRSARALTQLALESDLAEALRTNALTLFYQPIIDLETGRFAGLEALVRWFHPTRGLMMPGTFIPMAEATGLITDLTRWAIRDVCRRLPELSISALTAFPAADPLFVSVNVSAGDLIVNGFVEDVAEAVRANGIEPGRLKLEITESTMMTNLEQSVGVLHQLRGLGLHMSIDDFGTGYSSLSSLSRLPLDTLKIDRAFVTPLDTDDTSHRIVRAIIQLADSMQFDTVAEGIETGEQRDVVRRLGGRYGQGYLFGRPAPLDVTHELIRNWTPAPHARAAAQETGQPVRSAI